MKTATHFSRFLLLSCCFVSFYACTESKDKKSYNASIASTSATTLPQEETRFLFTLHNMGLYNLQLATEAHIRSTSVESVTLAESILNSNNKMTAAISAIANEYDLDLPADITEQQKMEWKEVVKQKGWAFDKKFAAVMEANLKSLYTLMNDASKYFNDPAIKKLASESLGSLQIQGTLAIAQQEKIKERTGRTDRDKLKLGKDEIASNSFRKK